MALTTIVHGRHRDILHEKINHNLLIEKVSMPIMYYHGKGHN